MSKQSSTGVFLSGLMIGSAVGTVVGLLIAPRTGKETRKTIEKSVDALPDLAEDISTSIQLQAGRLSESTLENWEGTLDRLRLAIAAGVETSRTIARSNKLSEQEEDLNPATTDRL
ncbi:MAG: YtxH domain-containing protein [Cyanobacteria bacterium J06607_15]